MSVYQHTTQFAQQTHQLSMDTLLCCEEEQWDDLKTAEYLSDEDVKQSHPFLLENDMLWENEQLSNMLSKEKENENKLCSILVENPLLGECRHDAIEWMLKVVGHYSFSALTASLAVNYLDRFLFSFQSHHALKSWIIQLSALACLSIAAKLEETQVPLLLDLQVEECKYIFEAKTIERMEILVLSRLQWKMNPVTPLSFLDFIIRRLPFLDLLFFNKCQLLLVSVISDCRFTCYLPSEMATAIMLEVMSNFKPSTLLQFQEKLFTILGINKEKVKDCCRIIKEVASTVDLNSSANKRRLASLPGSPKGVMDVSFSSDSYNGSWPIASSWSSSSSSSSSSLSSSPQSHPPLSKKCRRD